MAAGGGYAADWDPNDRDVEGWEQEAIRPTLIEDIQKVLTQYPDDGQILKEMVQNAEDAEATAVKILADTRSFHQDLRPEELANFPHLKYLKGPGLCVYNNGQFAEDDWQSIRMLHKSVKEKNPLKVGRFGLGFKSVFHLTDLVVIISRNIILYMDPSKDEKRYCLRKPLADIRGRELQSLLQCMEGPLFQFSRETFRTGVFPGTLFWFPLRQRPTDLSTSTAAYTERNLLDLLKSFKEESSSMLLFLNNIEQVHGYCRTSAEVQNLFSVNLAHSCLTSVRSARQDFLQRLPRQKGTLPAQAVCSSLIQLIETTDHKAGTRDTQTSLIVSYCPGLGEISAEHKGLCTNPELNYRPCVGVAYTNSGTSESQVFCTLPLPLGTRSITGLPVHVNGCFAVSQNRRHLEWPDRRRQREFFEPTVKWNLFLVEVLLPRAYVKLLEYVVRGGRVSAGMFYSLWPDMSRVEERWRVLAEELYRRMAGSCAFFTEANRGRWIALNQAVLRWFPKDVSEEVADSVVKVYRENQMNLVELPRHVLEGLDQHGLLHHVTRVSPSHVSRIVSNCLKKLTRDDKLRVLEYLYSKGRIEDLENLELLPLANHQFGVFTSQPSSSVIYWCDGDLQALFPDIPSKLCDTKIPTPLRMHLRDIAKKGTFALHFLHAASTSLPEPLGKNLEARRAQGALSSDDPWMQEVWQFLSRTKPWHENLLPFQHLALLPSVERQFLTLLPLIGIYVCSTSGRLFYNRKLSQALSSCLTQLGVRVISELPSYVSEHSRVLGQLVHLPETEGILAALEKIASNQWACREAVQKFNANTSAAEREELLALVESASNISPNMTTFLRQLRMFTLAGSNQYVSLQDVNVISPHDFPPVLPRPQFLSCSPRSRNAALKLGARETTLKDVVKEMLSHMQQSRLDLYTKAQVSTFMKYFIDRRDLLDDHHLLSFARGVKFVSTSRGNLEAAEDLYDPASPVLSELFSPLGRLPTGEYAQPNMLKKLRKLGLRAETNIDGQHLITAAEHIGEVARTGQSSALRKSEAMWTFLASHGNSIQPPTLQTLSDIQCVSCLQDKPEGYPQSLPLKSTPAVVRPAQLCETALIKMTGSAVPAMRPGMQQSLFQNLQINSSVSVESIMQHLHNVVRYYNQDEAPQYRLVLVEIFALLNHLKNPIVVQKLKQAECILVESADRFVKPNCVWVQRGDDDLDLKPYRFQLVADLQRFKDLFLQCGSSLCQDEEMLREVISTIQSEHDRFTDSHPNYLAHLKLVKKVLDKLKELSSDGTVPIPIFVRDQPNVLRFKPARECTIISGTFDITDSEMFYVLPSIPRETALTLGALEMRERSLTGLEAIDFDFGQREDLRDRIQDLLEHSYKDGLSVPKELIQNADDAGAREVRFLLDERENLETRSNLFCPEMASQQGPAIWAYNDAKFSEEDVVNITRLGGLTKKDDATKVGKFGLGFNAVYNLTDTPCFLSGRIMGMFDPEEKYLNGKPGMKIDFSDTKNRFLLETWPASFRPFQGVFGCKLSSDGGAVDYEGTLFRFPLRTPQQEEESRLNGKCYNVRKRRELLKLIIESAGNLLMFTQNVEKLQVFYLPSNSCDPASPICLLTVKKKSIRDLADATILKYCKETWPRQRDIRIIEELDISVEVTDKAQALCGVNVEYRACHWRLAWATGVGEAAQIALRYRRENLLPLAAAAVPLSDGHILKLRHVPANFYKTGHLFCFLPLPEGMVGGGFPVHVNATFSLTSSRRRLQEQAEGDSNSEEVEWNQALFVDPVCRAYTLLLENIQNEAHDEGDYSTFFDLWPQAQDYDLRKRFYANMTVTGSKLFPVPHTGQWVGFQDARFLEPAFRDSECGSIAWKVLKTFWRGDGSIVDVPASICRAIEEVNGRKFTERVVTKVAFYRDVLFPNIHSDSLSPEERDRLVYHAVMQNDKQVHELVRNHACIPCEGASQLKAPKDLVHPKMEAAKLFLLSEGVFPKETSLESRQSVKFCSKKCLERLAQLGMTTNDLTSIQVLERARSVGKLSENDAVERARYLIDYLSSFSDSEKNFRFDLLPQNMKSEISQTKFLPVMTKPEGWPFPWKDDEDMKSLAAPYTLFSENLRNLVACTAKMLDQEAMKIGGSRLHGKMKEVLSSLGVTVNTDHGNLELLELAIRQLEVVAGHCKDNAGVSREYQHNVTGNLYSFLDECIRHDRTNQVAEKMSAHLTSEECVCIGAQFASPKRVAFCCDFDCQPYLFKLESSNQKYRCFFEAVGVKQEFDATDCIGVLQQLNRESDGQCLSEDKLDLVARVAQLLAKSLRSTKSSVDTSKVFLPDRQGYMRCASELCLDDTDWLRTSSRMKFVCDKISHETAKMLGVQTKKTQDCLQRAKRIPYEQREKLTTRIKGLLKGYVFDSSVLKELIQNADDAGATEIKFIKDFRQLGREKIMDGWEKLQGPALSVYNNASFTEEDMEGIISLGEGSKASDPLKIGQYGVGFNAVYHLTDAPSFWTRTDKGEETMATFDPNSQFMPPEIAGGCRFEVDDEMKQSYPDQLEGFLLTSLGLNNAGTTFRFPLRNEEMAKTSKIKQTSVSEDMVENLLETFKVEMGACLLFLSNIQCIGIYSVNLHGSLVLEHELRKDMDAFSVEKMREFQHKMEDAIAKIGEGASSDDIPEFEAVISMSLTDSNQHRQEWVTVCRIGLAANKRSEALQNEPRADYYQLLPRGGVAVQLSYCSPQGQRSLPQTEDCSAFCMLPLPVNTGLPMHVNGHFALDHETRRDLWDNKGMCDSRTEWNKAIALQVIVPAYITAIQHVKHLWFTEDKQAGRETSALLQRYHALFPDLQNAPSKRPWRLLMEELYKQIAKRELPLFPVVDDDEMTITAWAPVVKTDGFPGYFSDSAFFFRQVLDIRNREQSVVLSQGGARSVHHQSSKERQLTEVTAKFHKLLKNLNMSVLHTPYSVMKHFKESGVECVQDVRPSTVIAFLKSSRERPSQKDGCKIDDLPKPVSSTPLVQASNVQLLLKFVKLDPDFCDKIEGLPFCLRQSGHLHFFEKTEEALRPIVSDFYHLLPGSSGMFLHEMIIEFFKPIQDKVVEMMREMDIPMFAQLLSDTLSESTYKTRKPCKFLPDCLPSKEWLKHAWKFLEQQLTAEKTTAQGKERVAIFQEKLSCLADWSLVPVRRRVGDRDEELLLVPVKDVHNVVHLPATRDDSHPDLWKILKSLPLSFLDVGQLPVVSLAAELVASIGRPAALLHALTSCEGGIHMSTEHAKCVLQYFDTSLPTLQESIPDGEHLRQKLKSLPFFIDMDGNIGPIPKHFACICIPEKVPSAGLTRWSQERGRGDQVVLLRHLDVPERLCNFLGLTKVSSEQFYCWHLLPTFAALPRTAVLAHMKFLKSMLDSRYPSDTEEIKALCAMLQGTAFIELNGQMLPARHFFTPFEPVFRKMCPVEKFPPTPYCDIEWSEFMRKAGIECEVTEEMFVDFARMVEAESQNGLTETTANKSQVLVIHLFRRRDLTTSRLLELVRSIRFLPPSDWKTTSVGERLALIAVPLPHERLVSFAESCSENHLYLVWTSSCILHPAADPLSMNFPDEKLCEILRQLSWQKDAPEDTVTRHIQKLCEGLQVDKPHNSLAWRDDNMQLLLNVMTTLYTYLQDQLNKLNLRQLAGLPLICDIENKQMLRPENVVQTIADEDIIPRYLHKLPIRLGAFVDLFEGLGVKKHVTADHYAKILCRLKEQWGDKELHVEAMKTVGKAVEGLFKCLKSPDEEKSMLTVDHVYLPSEQLRLLKSTELVFGNSRSLVDQCKKLPDTNLHFFLDFDRMEIHVSSPQDQIRRLPEKYKMMWLSDIMKETIPYEIKITAGDGDLSRRLADLLTNSDCVACLVRLAYHQHTQGAARQKEFDEEEITSKLSLIDVREVTRLRIILQWRDQMVPGSETMKPSFVDRNDEGTFTLYIDTHVSEEESFWGLSTVVQRALKFRSEYLVHLQNVFENPAEASRMLDKFEIKQYNVKIEKGTTVFPPPGTYVPVRFHCYLDNSLGHVFRIGEHVGFELHDPQNEEHTEGDDPIYIYAVVRKRVGEDSGDDTPAFLRRYIIDVGQDLGGNLEVVASQLFKLIDPPLGEFVELKAAASNEAAVEEAMPLDMNEVLREIRQILTQAWRLQDLAERRRVVRRLYLKYHPDKNLNNIDFFTRVTQKIQYYVSLLEEGRSIEELVEDEADVSRFASSSSFSSFFTRMDERSRRDRDYYEANARDQNGHRGGAGGTFYSSSSSSSSASYWYRESAAQPNPQPGEARRWMKQAEADLASAQAAKGTCQKGYNWVCYMCHQAVEKALKAVILHRNANNRSQQHELGSLARWINDPSLTCLAEQLQCSVGIHIRMRYPDAHNDGRIPADVYSNDQAWNACILAEQAVQQARRLLC